MVEMAIFNSYNVQRAVTPKVDSSELWFLYSALCLMVHYICMKFREHISNGIKVMERTRNCLIVLFICVRFYENISNNVQLTKRIRVHGGNGYVQCSKGNNSKNRQTIVTDYVFCILSYGALHLNYEAVTNGRTTGRTGTQNFGRYNTPRIFFFFFFFFFMVEHKKVEHFHFLISINDS